MAASSIRASKQGVAREGKQVEAKVFVLSWQRCYLSLFAICCWLEVNHEAGPTLKGEEVAQGCEYREVGSGDGGAAYPATIDPSERVGGVNEVPRALCSGTCRLPWHWLDCDWCYSFFF